MNMISMEIISPVLGIHLDMISKEILTYGYYFHGNHINRIYIHLNTVSMEMISPE